MSRPIVREALQRLSHAGLVEVRQGGATTVRDFRRHAGLNVLAQLLVQDGRLDLAVARSVLEARLGIGPEVAALAAQKGQATQGRVAGESTGGEGGEAAKARASHLAEVVSWMDGTSDPVELQKHALDFWDRLVDAADSIVFRLMFNSLRAAYEPMLAALATVMHVEVRAYRTLVDAVRAGDPEAARRSARQLLEPSTAALLDTIHRLEATS